MRKYFIGAVVGLILVAGVAFNEVIIKPFPFLEVDYVSSAEWDAEPDPFYVLPSGLNPPKKLVNEISSARDFESIDAKVTWAASLARDFMRSSKGDRIRGVAAVFDDAESYTSVCSESAKVFAALMTEVGVPSRVVWMHGHTVSEIHDGDKWVLIDTYGNVRADDKIGEPLGIREVLFNYQNSRFRKVVEDPNDLPDQYLDTGYLEQPENFYRQQNLLLIVKGDHLFTFHHKTRDLEAVLKTMTNLEANAVGEARQLVIDDYFVGNFGVRLFARYDGWM